MCIKQRGEESAMGRNNPGVANFEMIRSNGWLYVDRTEYVYRMVKKCTSDFLFSSHPCRLGRKLVSSTLDCLFRGRRDLFEGLNISGTDYDFKEYPVIHLDFSKFSTESYEAFRTSFEDELIRIMAGYGVDLERTAPSIMLNKIFYKTKEQFVLIIDEYDSQVSRLYDTECEDPELEDIETCLSCFFHVMKAHSNRLRFIFVAGQGSLPFNYMDIAPLDGLNILKVITHNEDFIGAFELADEEISFYENLLTDGPNRDSNEE